MRTASEEIWAWIGNGRHLWTTKPGKRPENACAYVRGDIHDAAVRQRDALLAAARIAIDPRRHWG